MVKLLSVIFFNCVGDRDPVIVLSSFNLSSYGFFEKSGVKEFCTFASRECVKRIQPGNIQSVEHKGYKVGLNSCELKNLVSIYILVCISFVSVANVYVNLSNSLFNLTRSGLCPKVPQRSSSQRSHRRRIPTRGDAGMPREVSRTVHGALPRGASIQHDPTGLALVVFRCRCR
jgi:hypothetical protein